MSAKHGFICFALLLTYLSNGAVASISVSCSITEECKIGSFVCNVAENIVTSSHATNNTFTMLATNKFFVLDKSSGKLTVKNRIDREALVKEGRCSQLQQGNNGCQLEFTVYQEMISNLNDLKLIQVTVEVLDINDNAPRFHDIVDGTVQKSVLEHDTRAIIHLPLATDLDFGINGSVFYLFPEALSRTSLYQKFSIDNNPTRGAQIRVVGDLDKEIESGPFRLIITARDKGEPAMESNLTLNLNLIDKNDYAPQFTSLKTNFITVLESIPRGAVVIQLQATDRDVSNHIQYDLIQTETNPDFRVRHNTGEIIVARSLDAEKRAHYVLQVTACDGHAEQPLTTTMTISIRVMDENDNDPEIIIKPFVEKKNQEIVVQENKPALYPIALVIVSDADVEPPNNQVSCDIFTFQSTFDAFKMELVLNHAVVGGRLVFKLVTSRSLDREERHRYDLTLTCKDRHVEGNVGANQQVRSHTKHFVVYVGDENDNGPMFAQAVINMRVRENAVENTLIGKLISSDLDSAEHAQVRYELLAEFRDLVHVDKSSGQVRTKRSFDREVNSTVMFWVQAFDVGLPQLNSTQRVLLHIDDENDNAPCFRQGSTTDDYVFEVIENSEPRRLGRLFADDADEGQNAKIAYSLEPNSNQFSYWNLQADGTLLLTTRLDYEVKQVYHLTVLAYDHGKPSLTVTTTLTIRVVDENDHAPQFVYPAPFKSTVNISMYEKQGALLTTLHAEDKDSGVNGQVIFTLGQHNSAGCPANIFDLNPLSGELRLLRDLSSVDVAMNDRRSDCHLSVVATDQAAIKPKMTQSFLKIRFLRPESNSAHGAGGDEVNRETVIEESMFTSRITSRKFLISFGIGLAVLVLFCVVAIILYVYCINFQQCSSFSDDNKQDMQSTKKGFLPGRPTTTTTTTLTMDGANSNDVSSHNVATTTLGTAQFRKVISLQHQIEDESFLKSTTNQDTLNDSFAIYSEKDITYYGPCDEDTTRKPYLECYDHDDALPYKIEMSISDRAPAGAEYCTLQDSNYSRSGNLYSVYEGNKMPMDVHYLTNESSRSINVQLSKVIKFPKIDNLLNQMEKDVRISAPGTPNHVERHAGYVTGSPYVTSSFV